MRGIAGIPLRKDSRQSIISAYTIWRRDDWSPLYHVMDARIGFRDALLLHCQKNKLFFGNLIWYFFSDNAPLKALLYATALWISKPL